MEQRIITKVGWLTNTKTIYIPPKTKEEIEHLKLQENEYIHNMFRVKITFLQDKGMTERTVLRESDAVDDETQLTVEDLTEDGLRFYVTGVTKWIEKLDRSSNRTKIVADTSFLEKKYREYMDYELPFFKALLSEVNGDEKIFESSRQLAPIIESLISGLGGSMKDFFAKRNIKTTAKVMSVFGYQYFHWRNRRS
jgi:sugar diacid utilization regulator